MADRVTIAGTVEHVSIGTGAWALVTNDGVTYELYEAPSELKQEGLAVTVEGAIRDDVMSLAAIGPILEVASFEIVEP